MQLFQNDVRYLKMYNSHYAEEGKIGDLMYCAQKECFDNHNLGVCVSNQFSQHLRGNDGSEYPIYGQNTTLVDYDEATFVMENKPCTAQELQHFRNSNDDDDSSGPVREINYVKKACDTDEVSLNKKSGEFGYMSKTAKRMKHGVSMLEKSSTDDNDHSLNERQKDEWFKQMIDKTKEIVNDYRFIK